MTGHGAEHGRLIEQAADIACRARDEDNAGLHAELRQLDPDRLAGLALALALMVDVDHERLPVYTSSHRPGPRPEQTSLFVRHCRSTTCGRLFATASGHRWYCTTTCRTAARRGQYRASKTKTRKAAA